MNPSWRRQKPTMAEDPKNWNPQKLKEKLGELSFQPQFMGEPIPLLIGGYRLRVTDRIHPEADYKLDDGEIYLTHEPNEEDGHIEAIMMVNAQTWEYLEKHIFRMQDGSYFRVRWANMHPEQFVPLMQGVGRRAREHFYEANALRYVLDWMRLRLHKECLYRINDDVVLEKAHRIVLEANSKIVDIIQPSLWLTPIQLRVDREGDNIQISRIYNEPLCHENFMKEFGKVIEEWERAWMSGYPPSEVRKGGG